MSEQNPYASPISAAPEPAHDPVPIDLDPKDRKKIKALINDAGSFWLAIILSTICYGCGAFILPIWYSMRLIQWCALANKYPALLAENVPRRSLQAKFKSARWKFILGIVVGGLLLVLISIYVVFNFNRMR